MEYRVVLPDGASAGCTTARWCDGGGGPPTSSGCTAITKRKQVEEASELTAEGRPATPPMNSATPGPDPQRPPDPQAQGGGQPGRSLCGR
ncbi:MAG: hypothetical protein WKF75_10465 [Singulisphaera sp.]